MSRQEIFLHILIRKTQPYIFWIQMSLFHQTKTGLTALLTHRKTRCLLCFSTVPAARRAEAFTPSSEVDY